MVFFMEKRVYSTNLQFLMYYCNIDTIDLYVYSPKGSLCVTLKKNEYFLKESVQIVKKKF